MGVLKSFCLGAVFAVLGLLLPRLFQDVFAPTVEICPEVPNGERCCKVVTSPELQETQGGTEDVVVDKETGITFFSVADHRSRTQKQDFKPGFIYQYNPSTGKVFPVPIENLDGEFHPHGISLYVEGSKDSDRQERFLFVISHTTQGDRIHRLRILGDLMSDETFMRQLDVIQDPAFISLNDVVAVDALNFYATNDHAVKEPLKQLAGDVMMTGVGNVVFYSVHETETKIAASGLNYPNGINVSRDGKYLYVAESLTGNILTYSRSENGDLELVDTYNANSLVDNIDVDPISGNLWIGSHPSLARFLAHASSADEVLAPAQVILGVTSDSGDKLVSHYTVYQDNGDELSALSVAVPSHHSGRMVAGAVFESKVLDCPLARQTGV